MKVLVTGATGNVGKEVIRSLESMSEDVEIIAGVRNIARAQESLSVYKNLQYRRFDFDDLDTVGEAIVDIDILFLLRPPHISNIEEVFAPLLKLVKDHGLKKIVFLSVQGAEKSKIIPHNKIEGLLNSYEFETVNLRPSYFMQNLTTTLKDDIKQRKIILPSKDAKFNWIDIGDIGEVAARVIIDFKMYRGQNIELTGSENICFGKVVDCINNELSLSIEYINVNPLKYYYLKKKEGYEKGQIIVMMLLHLLPRFQKEPEISHYIKEITHHKPITIVEFINNNADIFRGKE